MDDQSIEERVRDAINHDADELWCFTCHVEIERCDGPGGLEALDTLLTELKRLRGVEGAARQLLDGWEAGPPPYKATWTPTFALLRHALQENDDITIAELPQFLKENEE